MLPSQRDIHSFSGGYITPLRPTHRKPRYFWPIFLESKNSRFRRNLWETLNWDQRSCSAFFWASKFWAFISRNLAFQRFVKLLHGSDHLFLDCTRDCGQSTANICDSSFNSIQSQLNRLLRFNILLLNTLQTFLNSLEFGLGGLINDGLHRRWSSRQNRSFGGFSSWILSYVLDKCWSFFLSFKHEKNSNKIQVLTNMPTWKAHLAHHVLLAFKHVDFPATIILVSWNVWPPQNNYPLLT